MQCIYRVSAAGKGRTELTGPKCTCSEVRHTAELQRTCSHRALPQQSTSLVQTAQVRLKAKTPNASCTNHGAWAQLARGRWARGGTGSARAGRPRPPDWPPQLRPGRWRARTACPALCRSHSRSRGSGSTLSYGCGLSVRRCASGGKKIGRDVRWKENVEGGGEIWVRGL